MGITITHPAAGTKVALGTTIDFAGRVALGTDAVEVSLDDGAEVPPVTLTRRDWEVATRLNRSGPRSVVVRALDAAGREIGRATVEVEVVDAFVGPPPPPGDPATLVPIPRGINAGIHAAKQSTMLQIFGEPCPRKADCTAVTNEKVKRLLVTRSVGPFRVTGVRPAVDAMERVFTAVKRGEPDLYPDLGTAGVLCCRRIRTLPGRPPSRNWSNHSWGTAIDMMVKGALDPRGDGKTQLGVARIAPYFHAERFYWGAGFRGEHEDAMHFEASDELVRDWEARGLLR
jgi:hypothetical protein